MDNKKENIQKRENSKINTKTNNDKTDNNQLSVDASTYREGKILMNTILNERIFEKEVMGLRELRNNLSEIMNSAITSFGEVLSGNVKKGGDTASIISTTLLNEILSKYEFNPKVSFDTVTNQHEILLEEIGVYSCASTLKEALTELIDLVIDSTEDFFEQRELYMRTNLRNQFPYYLRINHCNNIEELLEVLNLDKKI